jgi:hypothetical protein
LDLMCFPHVSLLSKCTSRLTTMRRIFHRVYLFPIIV